MAGKRRRTKSKIGKLQSANAYQPCKRLRSQCLCYAKLQKLNAGLANNISYGWELTSNVRVLEPKPNMFHIVMLSRGRKSDTKGKRVASSYYDSRIIAENNIFSFRKSYESERAKTRLGAWEAALGTKNEKDVMAATLRDASIKQTNSLYRKKLKTILLTGSLHIEHKAPTNLNPNNHKFGARFLTQADVEIQSAKKIQRNVRKRDRLRAKERERKTNLDQTYRKNVISTLQKKLAEDEPWRKLIIGADDDEVAASTSDFDRDHVVRKARHIIDALRVLILRTEQGRPVTWKDACVLACEENYHRVGFRTVMMWYLDLHTTTTGDLCFTKSTRGSSSAAATSPFQEDESLLVQFKAWARSDLEHLTIKKATEWTNEKLLAGWTMEQLKAMNISVPVKANVVAN